MIKNVKGSGKTKTGKYIPVNKDKYIGKYPIIFRSSWEEAFCKYCDSNSKIKRWSSESIEIPYINAVDGKRHRYYPDFYIEVEVSNQIQKHVIEVKPHGFLKKPKKPKKQTIKSIKNYNDSLKRYITILSKTNEAKQFCKKRGMKFSFVTEKEWKQIFNGRI